MPDAVPAATLKFILAWDRHKVPYAGLHIQWLGYINGYMLHKKVNLMSNTGNRLMTLKDTNRKQQNTITIQ